jgi:hypothetical protein
MPLVTRQTVISLWHYHCPQCGIGSAETGAFAVVDMIYCEVCIEDGQPTRLKRWPIEEEDAPPGGVSPLGVAALGKS